MFPRYNPLNLNYKRIYNLIKKLDISKHNNYWTFKGTKNNISFSNVLNNKLIFYSTRMPYKDKIVIKDENNNILLSLFLSVKDSKITILPLQVSNNWMIINNIIKNSFINLIQFIEDYLYYDDYDKEDVRMLGLIVPIK